MENWAEIRRLHRAEGLPIKAIVRQTGVSRSAVRRASSTVYRTVLQTTLRGSFQPPLTMSRSSSGTDAGRRPTANLRVLGPRVVGSGVGFGLGALVHREHRSPRRACGVGDHLGVVVG